MGELGTFLQDQIEDLDRLANEQVEVIGDSIEECLALAAKHLNKKVHELDYIILKRGKKKFLFSEPFHIRVSAIPEDEFYNDLMALDEKLTGGSGKLVSKDLKNLVAPKNRDGWSSVKILKNGVYLYVFPPLGDGRKVTQEEIVRKLSLKGVEGADQSAINKAFREQTGEAAFISNQKPKPGREAKIMLDLSPDNMTAKVTVIPAKPGGKDLEVKDIVNALKRSGVVYGFKEEDIKQHLDADKNNVPFTAAAGDPPVNGKNASVIYHVRTEKKINFKEDASGKVDYKDLNLIENVVAGQLLAEKVPAEKGKFGRTLFNQMIPAKDGIDIDLKQGKGTILSEDRKRLTAEVNGQVLFAQGKLSVETIYRVSGDVSIKSGNVTFLGSVVITGNVEDNYSVKAAGNVEVFGTVQKANIEADGDIIIRQGISGRDEARIESTGGNVIAKFIQNATVITDKDVLVQEGIMHSNVSAGGRVICKGKRAQIVGGKIQAGSLIAAKTIGSSANPQTDLIVGFNPKILQQIEDYQEKAEENREKLDQVDKSYKTIQARKEADPASFTEANQKQMEKLGSAISKLEKRIHEYETEIQTLQAYLEEQAKSGAISIEKILYGGITLKIRNAEYKTKNEVKNKTFIEDNGLIKQIPYEDPDPEKYDRKKKRRK